MFNRLIVPIGAAVAFGVHVEATGQPATPLPASPSMPIAAPTTRPGIGPTPAWVLAAPIPAAPAAAGDAAIVLLLNDQQVRLTDGGEERYVNSIYRIGSAQALQAAAAGVTWDPALETVTIHRFRLLRDGKPIDLLGDGSQATVVRREPNLEQAALDGRLTATFQPEDVRVGDVVDFAFTQTRRDPALAGRIETGFWLAPGVPIGRARVRVLWPDAAPVRWRAAPGFPSVKAGRVAGQRELIADVDNFTPPRPPSNAPARFGVVDALELTNAADWTDVARTGEALFASAATIRPGSPLAAEIERIKAAATDPKVRAAAALKLVQEQVRYLFLGMDGGGYRPAAAELSWARRFGDCKAKTALLLGMLRALDIEAWPALVQTEGGNAVATLLPRMGAFDHVLVQARIGGKLYWLDGTRPEDRDLERIRPPAFEWALPLRTDGKLEAIPVPPLDRPETRFTLDLDAREGLAVPARATAEFRVEGDAAIIWRVALRQLSPVDRDRALREFWREQYSFVTPDTVGTSEDPATGALSLTLKGSARMDWGAGGPQRYRTNGASIGFKIDVTRNDELMKDAPFAVAHPFWNEHRQTILLPNGGKNFALDGGDVDKTLGAYAFKRQVKLEGERFTLRGSVRSLAPEMLAAVAIADEGAFRELANGTVYVRAPRDYALTAAERAALKGRTPTTAAEYVERAVKLLEANDTAAGLVDLEAALKLEPGSSDAMGKLAGYLIEKDPARAAALADQALAKDPKQWNALAARGLLADKDKRYADAERAFTQAIDASPNWTFALFARARVRSALGRVDDALADATAFEAAGGDADTATGLRVMARLDNGKAREALPDLDKLVGLRPDNMDLRSRRASVRFTTGDRAGARADHDLVLAKAPSAGAYLERAQTWKAGERAQWSADLDAAQKLEPRLPAVWKARAVMEARAGNYAEAERALAEVVRLAPDDGQIRTIRNDILRRTGRLDSKTEIVELERVVARQEATAHQLNELCWLKATSNTALDSALANCEAAVRLAPRAAAYLDSRAFVRFRLREFDAAIADYDAALALVPTLAASLYGRGLAKTAKGDKAGGAADFAAARKVAPDVDAEFRRFGVVAPNAPDPAGSNSTPARSAS